MNMNSIKKESEKYVCRQGVKVVVDEKWFCFVLFFLNMVLSFFFDILKFNTFSLMQ